MKSAARERKRRIGEFAAVFGLNPKTVRYYESVGLLATPERSPAGYRLYGESDLDRLEFVIKARSVGFRLDEIGQILRLRFSGQKPCEHVLSLIGDRIATLEEQLRALADVRQQLVTLREEAAKRISLEACVCPIIEHHQSGPRRANGAHSRPLRVV